MRRALFYLLFVVGLAAPALGDSPFHEEIAGPRALPGAAVFLASPVGAFINGHNLVVDGGTLISDGS